MPKSTTSYTPREGKRFDAAVKVSLHRDEMDRLTREAWKSEQTASEWARDAVRMRLEQEGAQ